MIDSAAAKPFGFVPYSPVPGLGGHCIPIDPFYLTWKAREYSVTIRFIELTVEVNSAMPARVVGKLIEGLNDQAKPFNGSEVLIVGVAYKKNVGDTRESPALEIMELTESGCELTYEEPPADDPTQRQPDISMAHQILNGQPQVELRSGVRQTNDYFKNFE